ncbi:MAG TPA: alkaline shock response membrane anchor protein AmaP [Clostridiales bacterium]|nr:alkaline shock response membrane anchor protein AmaP [Clostridiales bacterium]
MGVFDRVVLTIFALSNALLSALLLAVLLGWTAPLLYLGSYLQEPRDQWLLGSLAAIMLAVSSRFLYYGMRRPRQRRSLVHEGPLGETTISLGAVESLVAKVVRQLRGVREIRPRVHLLDGNVHVFIRAVVGSDVCVPEWSEEVQRTVRNQVRTIVGVDVAQVRVLVSNISSEPRRGRLE